MTRFSLYNFLPDVTKFLRHLPPWDMIYLGGQHIHAGQGQPHRVNEYVYQPYNVNRTHAFAINVKDFGDKLYQWLHKWDDWKGDHHIDHHLGRLHETRGNRVFCPVRWLVGQRSGQSDVNERFDESDRYWRPAHRTQRVGDNGDPFYVIMGLHSSGSSALAGVCYRLGLYLGNDLTGYYGKDPSSRCGYEDRAIADLCQAVAPLDSAARLRTNEFVYRRLKIWIDAARDKARLTGTLAGCKYPQLCVMGQELRSILGDRLRVIVPERPLDESIRSIWRRTRRNQSRKLAAHQQWLHDQREAFLETLPEGHVMRVSYDYLLESSTDAAAALSRFLGIGRDKIEEAAAYVDPSMRHVKA